MSKNLIDPSQPAHAIIEEYDDGGAKRNDGTELSPATDNPWYVLATVYGEHENLGIDLDLQKKNRRIWNGWMCANLDDSRREELAQQLGVNAAELAPLETEERADLEAAFDKRLPGGAPTGRSDRIDFNRTYFSKYTFFGSFFFPIYADFQSATFREFVYFECASFSGWADFRSAKFAEWSTFRSATFRDKANFQSATFDDYANFLCATFNYVARFESAEFSNSADFQYAMFAGPADFQAARFNGGVSFSDGAFHARTEFDNATFQTRAPKFFQCGLHQDTVFTIHKRYWPKITDENAAEGKRAYTRLRQVMTDLYKPDDAHFFFRQEMRCKAKLEAWPERSVIWLYGFLSDFGYSVTRPACGLLGMWGIPALVYLLAFIFNIPDQASDLSALAPFGLSFTSLFAFFGLNRLYFDEVIRDFGPWLSCLAGAQTVAGVILVFFLGLGLRNRFRLR